MKRISIICVAAILLLMAVPFQTAYMEPIDLERTVHGDAGNAAPAERQQVVQPATDGVYQEAAYRSGRRPYTGGRTTPSPGVGTAPGAPAGNVRTTPRPNPATPPGYGYPNRGGGLGGLLGGFAAGALLGSLFNPFGLFGGGGYGTVYGGGLSFLSLLFWGVVIYFVFRLFRRAGRS